MYFMSWSPKKMEIPALMVKLKGMFRSTVGIEYTGAN